MFIDVNAYTMYKEKRSERDRLLRFGYLQNYKESIDSDTGSVEFSNSFKSR